MGLFISSVIGTIVGGIIVLLNQGALIIAVLMLSVSIISYWLTFRIPFLAPTKPKLSLRWNLASRIIAYLRDLKGNRTCYAAIYGIAWFWSFATIFLTQTSNYVKRDLKLDGDLATFYIALFSIGIAIGAVLCEKIRTQKVELRTPMLGAIGMSIFVYLFISIPTTPAHNNHDLLFFIYFNNWASIFCALMVGIVSAFYMVPLYALIHHTTNKITCPSAICLNNIIYSIFVILTTLISITLLQIGWEIRSLFILIIILNLIFNLALFCYEPKFIKSLNFIRKLN
jgi:hypothetical protein